jgi:hypothetical protein
MSRCSWAKLCSKVAVRSSSRAQKAAQVHKPSPGSVILIGGWHEDEQNVFGLRIVLRLPLWRECLWRVSLWSARSGQQARERVLGRVGGQDSSFGEPPQASETETTSSDHFLASIDSRNRRFLPP